MEFLNTKQHIWMFEDEGRKDIGSKQGYVCLIDWEKVFDRVNWSLMEGFGKDIDIDWEDKRRCWTGSGRQF